MFKKTVAMIATTLALAFHSVGAYAATVSFDITSVVFSFGPSSDGSLNATATAAASELTGLTAENTGKIIPVLFTMAGTGSDTEADSFGFNVAVTAVGAQIGTAVYNFIGNITSWTNQGNNVRSATLTWAQNPQLPLASPLLTFTLSTFSASNRTGGVGGFPVSLTYQAIDAPSVVPLPAGVLLLGTALLGLFGLSRRRKPAAA
jgi:hypothetical protein